MCSGFRASRELFECSMKVINLDASGRERCRVGKTSPSVKFPAKEVGKKADTWTVARYFLRPVVISDQKMIQRQLNRPAEIGR